MRILVLGGYGNFGARICRALVNLDVEVIAAGRDPDCGHNEAGFDSKISKARIDVFSPELINSLHDLSPDLVIHCVGPFQGQGYHVALAALDSGAHYIDLSDGRTFVMDFADAVDSAAKSANLLAITGASTLPALSSAVVNTLKNRFMTMEEIQISIAPAQRSPRGVATLQAVFSYLGRPFKWLERGAWRTVYGWQDLRCFRFAGLGKRWAAACDVPDLGLFPQYYPGVETVQFRAALEFSAEHLLLAFIAGLRRCRLPIPIERWAMAIDRIASALDRFSGEHGGMLVSITGTSLGGQKTRVEWHLTADSDHGPEIPCMATILLARKLVRGDIQIRGAMPSAGLLTLDEFSPEFNRRNIRTELIEVTL